MSSIRYMPGDDNIYHIHEYNLDYKANEIYLVGDEDYKLALESSDEPGVEFSMASKFIKNLNILARKSSNINILIHMKTCGGDWQEGMAIYDAIALCPNYTTILNYTHARSMSSLIFLAADERVMMPNSTYMFHQGTFGTYGTVKQTQTEFEELKKSTEIMLNMYEDHLKESKTGSLRNKSRKQIRDWLIAKMDKKEEVYFNAEEAVRLGFADKIFDGKLSSVATL